MNRHQRRAQAAKARSEEQRRREAICDALAHLATCADPDVIGATLILPSGETLHLTPEMARATKQDGEAAQ